MLDRMGRGLLIGLCCLFAVSTCEAQAVPAPAPEAPREQPHIKWARLLGQSGLFLGVQHSLRMVQTKTRGHLGGPFWSDYLDSVEGCMVGTTAIRRSRTMAVIR